MNWKFWGKDEQEKVAQLELDFTENIQAILNEQEKISIPHIERSFHDALESQKKETWDKCMKIIDEFIEIEGEKMNGEIDIARHIELLVRKLGNNVWHDFRNCRERYMQGVYNEFSEPYKKLRETVVVENSELRADLDQFERDLQFFVNISQHLVEGWNEKMINDRIDFFRHSIDKAKETTKLPRVLNERVYGGIN